MKLFCVMLLWLVHVIIDLSKLMEHTTLRSEVTVNCELEVRLTLWGRFTDLSQRYHPGGNVDGGGAQGGGIRELFVLTPQIRCEPPRALDNKMID